VATHGTEITGAEPKAADQVEEPPKKRGFWSKVFGVGKKGEKKDEKKEDGKKKPL
jgi:hypothetical protein